jgi:hypothetical protein
MRKVTENGPTKTVRATIEILFISISLCLGVNAPSLLVLAQAAVGHSVRTS